VEKGDGLAAGGDRFRRRRLTLRFHQPGIRLYTFSFTSCV
jgi:hypothetical protein